MIPALEVENLTFGYTQGALFQGLTLSFVEGEFTAILGRNGAGKTTLLKLLAGVLSPWSDGVRVYREAMSLIPARKRARLIGFVPQERLAKVPLTVREIVTLGRLPYLGTFSKLSLNDEAVISRELSALSLNGLANRKFSELSGGERQRVLIARALVQEPKILLLDEPTAHLDLQFQKEIMDTLESLSVNRSLTVIFAMHNVSLALRYAKRIVLLEQGRVMADGAPEEIRASGVLESVYGSGITLLEEKEAEVKV